MENYTNETILLSFLIFFCLEWWILYKITLVQKKRDGQNRKNTEKSKSREQTKFFFYFLVFQKQNLESIGKLCSRITNKSKNKRKIYFSESGKLRSPEKNQTKIKQDVACSRIDSFNNLAKCFVSTTTRMFL